MAGKTIKQLETTFEQLYDRLLRGQLADDEFRAEVDRLRVKDDEGHLWRMGRYTGQWYRYDEGQWVRGMPPERLAVDGAPSARSGAAAEGRARRPASRWLVAALVILLLGASVTLLVGWNADWEGASPLAFATATPAPQSSPTQAPGRPSRIPTTVPPSPSPPLSSPAPPPPTAIHRPEAAKPPTGAATSGSTATLGTRAVTETTAVADTATVTGSAVAINTATVATASPTRTPEPSASPVPTPTRPAATAPLPQPTKASPAGQIFFPVYDPDPTRRTFDIYAVRLGSGTRELVAGQASQPALSPDAKRLAYRSWDKSQRGIAVLELTSGHTWRWIESAEAARPSWSPDGQNIVFPSRQEADRNWRIYRTTGEEFATVRRQGADIFGRVPVWLADGRIVYWDCPLANCGLYVMEGDGTGPVRLTTAEGDTGPSASPDGQQIAFMSNRSGNWEIYLVPSHASAGTEVKRLTQNGARDGLPAWSPDGRWLAFASDRDGTWAVWAMRPDGSGLRRLFDLGGSLEGEVADAEPREQDGWPAETMAWGP